MPLKFGFFDYEQPRWQQYIDEADNKGVLREIIIETGLSKEKIEQVLEMLYDNRIIN
jgi:hypothetical protein